MHHTYYCTQLEVVFEFCLRYCYKDNSSIVVVEMITIANLFNDRYFMIHFQIMFLFNLHHNEIEPIAKFDFSFTALGL